MVRYSDTTDMPFGKFKGQKLANIPAYYLLWLLEVGCKDEALLMYIRDNFTALKVEKAREKYSSR